MRKLTIAIVGAGTTGLATCLFLQESGHRVTVFERFPTPKPVGAGLLLQPTGLAVLTRLGLGERIRELGNPVRRISGKTAAGRTIFDVGYERYRTAASGYGIHRGALFATLHQVARQTSADFRTGCEITATPLQGDGRAVVDSKGEILGTFDLVIDASGAHSGLRERYGRVRMIKPYPYGAVWGVAPDRDGWSAAKTLAQTYQRAATMIGILPIGRLPDDPESTRLLAFFWSLKVRDYRAWRNGNFAAWQDRVAALWPEAEAVVQHFRAPEDLALASYSDAILASPIAERLVFAGDAAHASSPQLGQGANLGLLDAAALGEALAGSDEAEHGGPSSSQGDALQDNLKSYARARRGHVRFYQMASRLLTPAFQSDLKWVPWLRDRTFYPMSRTPLLGRQMVRTLAGVKTGLLTQLDTDRIARGGPSNTSA